MSPNKDEDDYNLDSKLDSQKQENGEEEKQNTLISDIVQPRKLLLSESKPKLLTTGTGKNLMQSKAHAPTKSQSQIKQEQ